MRMSEQGRGTWRQTEISNKGDTMRLIGIAMLLAASFCYGQEQGDFKPATSNVLDAQYPKVDSTSRVQIRFKAPDATKVKLNFWSGPKVDMEKQADGFWTMTTPPLAPGLHYYVINVDGADVSDPGSTAYFGGSKWASAVEVPEAGADYYLPKDVPHGQVREIWDHSTVTGTWRHAFVYLPPDYDTDCVVGSCLLDHERGVAEAIAANPWQTDTCIGQWHYKRGQQYKTAKKVIDLLVDIVSKNGNLLLNFPLPNSGELDSSEIRTLEGITAWMEVNSEGIYGTRPWKIYGEGPSTQQKIEAGNFNEDKQKDLTGEDIRFTKKGDAVYAFVMGKPAIAEVNALGLWSPQNPGKIRRVQILGRGDEVSWVQDNGALRVKIPAELPSDIGLTLKVDFA